MMRFSAVTTIRGKNAFKVALAVRQRQAEVASLPHSVAFKTTIPRTGELLRVFLTDEDAVTFNAIREEHSPLKDRLVQNLDAKADPHVEVVESGLNQMVNEGALQQFLQQYPERDVQGQPHERIDCNGFWLKSGTVFSRVLDAVYGAVSSTPYVKRGQFDFWRDLKNPIQTFSVTDEDL
jgi:hypothetical protein